MTRDAAVVSALPPIPNWGAGVRGNLCGIAIMPAMSVLIPVAFVAILASLGAALFFMMRGGRKPGEGSRRMAWALTARIGLSVLLFLCILLAWKLGYIQPKGLPLTK